MDVKDILVKQIQEFGGNGLYNEGGECGCGILDLQPCGLECMDCIPAKRTNVDGEILYIALDFEED